MTARYHFLSNYRYAGDPDGVWATVVAVDAWPEWWSWIRQVEVVRAANGDDGTGPVYRSTVRAPAGYHLVFETEAIAFEPLRSIDVLATGELQGRGRFGLESRGDGELEVWFAWLVETTKRWMSALAPVARPVFSWNHDRIMDAFGTGLAARTGARLLSSQNTTVRPRSPGFWVLPETPTG